MTADPVDLIARAVLYEGYLLYPYRRSALKNRQRFNFGVLFPESYCRAHGDSERWLMQAECPVLGHGDTRLAINVRCLQLVERRGEDPAAEPWHEAIERDIRIDAGTFGALQSSALRQAFGFPAVAQTPTAGAGSPVTAPAAGEESVRGEVRVGVHEVSAGVYKLTVGVANVASLDPSASRDAALVRSLASAHAVIRVREGELVSMIDPPDSLRDLVASCANVGVWPVLVGEDGSRDCMLASPIILYDYPQVAPESAGDLFDGTEIDEILALRILTLTEDEKREARETDERVRLILDRTAGLTPEHWSRLHGVVRGPRTVTGGAS